MQTKVLEGSSVRDCFRPRRATGWVDTAGVSVLELAALPSEEPTWLSGAVDVC